MSSIVGGLARFRRRALSRVRGDLNLNRLVAQGMKLGEGCHISPLVYIDGRHPWLIEIEDYVTLAPHSSIIVHDASFAHYTNQTRLGRVIVHKRAYVGVGAILLPGTIIGEDSVVAAGAVIHGVVPPGSLVQGNPGKVTPLKAAVAWQRASARRAPSWPYRGWAIDTGITEERKEEQREALADAASGYIQARAAPDSPYEREAQREESKAEAPEAQAEEVDV